MYLEAAVTYAALGGHESAELIDASTTNGSIKNKMGWEGRWLMAGLTDTNWHSFPDEDKDDRNDQLQNLAGIIRASIYKAGGLTELAVMTVSDLDSKFEGSFQKAVRQALSDEAKGKVPAGGMVDTDVTGEDEAALRQQELDLLREVRNLGSVETLPNFRPSRPGQPFLLVGYWDEAGSHIAREISVSMSALSAMLPPPNLDDLDDNVNGISEHILLTKALLPNRPSQSPEDAQTETVTEATPMRVSGRTTMLRGDRLDTSLSHMSSAEMVITTKLSKGATLPAGPFIFHAPARAKFEKDVAPEKLRQHFTFGDITQDKKLSSLTFKRANSEKPVKIGLVPAGDWGSNRRCNPFAYRLSDTYNDVGIRSIGGEALARLKSEVLDNKQARQATDIEVRVKEGNLLLKAGKASSLRYEAGLDGKATDELRLSIPTDDFRAAMDAAVAGTTDGKVGISGDKRGVVCVSWTGRGATHGVYIASVAANGSRDHAGLFQRFDKTSF
ncbi:hypothetical protein [Brevundimonas sp. TWP2-3-4b2]|uniref:hypothetical protein n=1 Tax=Brevundimonas sp. TWP2-3-4b2 TaxID=2804595 RepID=UPI003CF146A3